MFTCAFLRPMIKIMNTDHHRSIETKMAHYYTTPNHNFSKQLSFYEHNTPKYLQNLKNQATLP
jgi:hypothetical protein